VAPTDSYALEVEDLELERGGRVVLSSVSARFPRAAVTAVVGPSGSGKTSFLRCLNRLDEPRKGRVLLDEIDVKSLAPTELRRRVGMIFQTPVVFEGGVAANLRYGLPEVGDADLAVGLESAGLPPSFFDRESSALSVGQAQRVCIARALVRKPDVLLMDEPTSALDKDAAARIEALINELAGRDLTIVLVTHNLEQARRLATHGFLLVDGRIRAAGTLDQLEAAWPGERTS
jgi:putative ABC transport system ATP-binding protein